MPLLFVIYTVYNNRYTEFITFDDKLILTIKHFNKAR